VEGRQAQVEEQGLIGLSGSFVSSFFERNF
jgi:hypothetical protein